MPGYHRCIVDGCRNLREDASISGPSFFSFPEDNRCWRKWGAKLPSLSTIRRWVCKLDFQPGRCQDILDCLKDKVERMHPVEKDCILTLDETALHKGLQYNRFSDRIEGFEDFGGSDRTMNIADYALVVMVRGLNTDWRMPLAYYYSCHSSTSSQLYNIVCKFFEDLFSIGLNVRGIVVDQGGCNQGMFKKFGVSIEKPFFMYMDKKIYFMYDVPHAIKNIRTGLTKYNFRMEGHEGVVSMAHIKEFYDIDCMSTFRCSSKLSDAHFNLTNLSKMKVKLATQLFSRSVASGMRTRIDLGELSTNFSLTAEFCERMDTIFDMCNISESHCPLKKWKSNSQVFQNLHEWKAAEMWLSGLTLEAIPNVVIRDLDYESDVEENFDGNDPNTKRKKVRKLPILPCIKGLRQTLVAQHMLIGELQETGYKFVKTRSMQSDGIEHIFGHLKYRLGSLDKANCPMFRRAFRFIFLSNLIVTPDGSNCEKFDSEDSIFDTQRKLSFFLAKTNQKTLTLFDQIDNDNDDENDNGFVIPMMSHTAATFILLPLSTWIILRRL
ncbi:uncharacterized protein LOC110858887 [Folsomia candida]|uniref:uncharacterized protein LOC110858887 n=1 Tax=Folsomia candida TaxID=158441 RepID=UPI000B8EFEB6|nr:uncharacterized protein LOC110858887 [Folsomia candida]